MGEIYESAVEIRDELVAIRDKLDKTNVTLTRIADALDILTNCVGLTDPVLQVRNVERNPR